VTSTPTSTPTHIARHGIVERDGNRGAIRFERFLAHPVERVWEAIATPGGLADWWLPFPATIEIDLVVGGLICFTAKEMGADPMSCEILELDPPYKLVHTHFDRSITLTWELEAEGSGCRLRLTQQTPDIAAVLAQGQLIGLHHSLDRLEPALDGTPAAWDWDRLPVIEAEYRDLLASPQQRVLDRYVDGFRTGDHAAILGCLTDDVTWDIVGHATANGREEFDALIDGPEGASLPRLTVTSCVESGGVIAVFGSGEFDDAEGSLHAFRFADAFTFRDELICGLVSFVIPT
jgi:uncharacterized protein YndB with AHSA1/START domain/ketosteroid isomerase-like protein